MTDFTSFIHNHIHLFQHPDAFLPFDNPTFGNPTFENAAYRVLIVRLSPFRDVDRSMPHLFLFHQTRQVLPQAYIDLAFFPAKAERDLLSENDIPLLIGTQSMRSMDAFDLVLISNAYTLELINLPYLLIRSGIPLFASQRGEEWPIMVLGGSNAMAAQAIVDKNGDCLVDAMFFGEGEGIVGELAAHLAQHQDADKRQTLADFAIQSEGLWVAGEFVPVKKAILQQPQAHLLSTTFPIMNSQEVKTANLQINYGCPAFCSFCFEGYERKPYRELPAQDIITAARRLKKTQGSEALNLHSFNFNTHSGIFDLLIGLDRVFERVSIKSQRVDLLQHTETLLETEIATGKRSFTLGIEGISERQRAWLHKSLSTADVTALLDRLFKHKVREVKLFFILTGHETDQDMTEFRAFVQQLKHARRQHKGTRVIYSFGLLIRMPFTPLRYDRLILDYDRWKLLIGQAKSACETNGFEFRLAFDWPTYCTSQVLAIGGYWLIEPVLILAEKGYCFDTTLPDAYWHELQSWMQDTGHWHKQFLGEKGLDTHFALDFVQTGISPEFLYQQFQACQAGIDDGYCLGNACLVCGACSNGEQRKSITGHRIHKPKEERYVARLEASARSKRRLEPIYLRLYLTSTGTLPEFIEALVLRELVGHYPEWIDNLLSVRESLFTERANKGMFPPLTMSGEHIFALRAWDGEAIRQTLAQQRRITCSGFEILGTVDRYTPGAYTQLDLEITLPTRHFSEPRKHLETYLRNTYLPYSLRRQGDGYDFSVPKKGYKKKVLVGGHLQPQKGAFIARLQVGTKFDLMTFLALFDVPNAHRHARVIVSKIEF